MKSLLFTRETFIIVNYIKNKYFQLILQMIVVSCDAD